MHTLSVFPSLLAYGELAPLLLRLILGAVLIHWGLKALKASGNGQKKSIGIIEGIAGILVFIGLYTQVAALVAGVDLLIRLGGKIPRKAFLTDGINYYLILLVLAISLLVTGPGWLAFDYPL